MSRPRADTCSLVSGVAVLGLGVLLALDRAGEIEIGFGYLAAALLAAAGAALFTSGLRR